MKLKSQIAFLSILVLPNISYAIDGCRINSVGTFPAYHRVYDIRRTPASTRTVFGVTYEVYTQANNFAIFPTPTTDCSRSGQGQSEYLLRTSSRSGNCQVLDSSNGIFVTGTTVSFTTPLRCPLDDYICIFIGLSGVLGFVIIRRSNLIPDHARS